MIKKFLPFFLLIALLFHACTTENVATTLASILTSGSGKWKVAYAKFGDEEAPAGMYDQFLVEFKNGGIYVATNPKGAIFPTTLPTGTWKEEGSNRILFDNTVIVREITQQRTPNKIILEWEVSIPNKVTTTYRIELIKAN
jgi:hypothetical protein